MALIKPRDIRYAFERLFTEFISSYDTRITDNTDGLDALSDTVGSAFGGLVDEFYYDTTASESIAQYEPVKADGNPGLVDVQILGFATHAADTGEDLTLKIAGIYQAYVSESVTAGALLSCAGDGTLVVADAGVVVAMALEDKTYVDTPLLCQILIK